MRKCENCSKLDGKYCEAGFSPIISKWTGAILRPSRCKKKYKTTKRQYALTWKKENSMRVCNSCGKLKYNKCSIGFNAVKSEKTAQILRPKDCHKKYRHSDKKQAELDYQSLKRQIDDAFQMYIRYRDGWRCVVCGKEIPPSVDGAKALMHGGHFLSRGHLSIRWNEANCHAQCAGCNKRQHEQGIDPRYSAYVSRKYGPAIFEFFEKETRSSIKYSAAELADILKMWQDKLAIIKEIYHNSLK